MDNVSLSMLDFSSSNPDHLCMGSNIRNSASCMLPVTMNARTSTIAFIRIAASSLGILGSMSIIVSVLARRRVLSSEVHPIFMLSLADCMLSVLWIAGSVIWFHPVDSHQQVWCYTITLMTAILECVAINLTVVYGMFALYRISKMKYKGVIVNQIGQISCSSSTIVYALAWIIPLVIVMIVFGSIAGTNHFLHYIEHCSCGCLPSSVNVLPFAYAKNNGTHKFVQKISTFTLSLLVILVLHYVVAFVSLLVIYWRTLCKIRQITIEYNDWQHVKNKNYGAVQITAMNQHQSKAKKRIILFLTAFICNGFVNLVVEVLLVYTLSQMLLDNNFEKALKIERNLLYAQSASLPLQGFLNAIVYGWTRDDFLLNVVGEPSFNNNNGDETDTTSMTVTYKRNGKLEESEMMYSGSTTIEN